MYNAHEFCGDTIADLDSQIAELDGSMAELSSFDDQMAFAEAKEGGAWQTAKTVALVTGVVVADAALVGGVGYGIYKLATR